jgi:hypothetical protein
MSVRLSIGFIAAGMLLALPSIHRADDDLNRFVEQNRLLAQKIKTEASHAMAEARTVQKNEPEQAKTLLEKALKQVQNATALAANEQTQLTSQLLGRIREVNELIREQKVARDQAPLKVLPKRTGTEAAGSGVSRVAKQFIEKGNAESDAGARFQEQKSQGFSAATGSIARSSVPPTDDVMFPKDWKDKTKLRDKYAGAPLSDKEVALLKALNSVMSVNYEGRTFKQVIEDLSERTGQSLIVDPNALKEAESDYSDPVNIKLNKVTVRTILRAVLANERLTYVIQEGTIQIVTPERAKQMMIVRTYPVSDIVAPTGFAARFGPFIAHAQMLANVQTLVAIVQNSVDPNIWRENGGGGSITFHESSMSLIIRAPAEFHYQFAGGNLFGGR